MKFVAGGAAAGLNRNALADRVDPSRQPEGVDAGQFAAGLRFVEPASEHLDGIHSLLHKVLADRLGVLARRQRTLYEQASAGPAVAGVGLAAPCTIALDTAQAVGCLSASAMYPAGPAM